MMRIYGMVLHQVVYLYGHECTDPVDCFVSILSHELIHLYISLYCPGSRRRGVMAPTHSALRHERPEHDGLFLRLARRLFGHLTARGGRMPPEPPIPLDDDLS